MIMHEGVTHIDVYMFTSPYPPPPLKVYDLSNMYQVAALSTIMRHILKACAIVKVIKCKGTAESYIQDNLFR